MRTTRILGIALAGLALAGAGTWWWSKDRSADPQWRTARLTRGALTAAVSASGSINPVASVQVGSQVSGQLAEVLVDFNSEVKANQVVARIDPETFRHRVRQAQADLDAAKAQVAVQQSQVAARRAEMSRAEVNLADGRLDLSRKEALVERNFISPAERDKARAVMRAQEEDLRAARAGLDVAIAQVANSQATVAQRAAALAAAQVDLDRTVIRSPVDGVVIKRSVEPGQTVAASLQSPELFVIAKNLHDMQVDTSIDESDIGRIRLGQKATFTVDAFPGRSFEGSVRQVRKSAQNVQNVVTYVVVVDFANADGLLLPGMTANVRIATEMRADVLQAPNAALRFRMPPELAARYPAPSSAGSGSNRPPDESKPGAALDGAAGWVARLVDRSIAPAWAQTGVGAAGGALRERIERELGLDDDQRRRIDTVYAELRPRFAALRDLPEDERPRASRALREELRDRIAATLRPDQRARYETIVAELAQQRGAPGGGASTAGAPPPRQTPPPQQTPQQTPPPRQTQAPQQPAQGSERASAPRTNAAAATTPSAAPSGTTPAEGAPAAGGVGGQIAAFRERLERELAPTAEQRTKLDAIFAANRDKLGQLRSLPEEQRAKAFAANRADMRARIAEILTPEQKKKYEAMLVEQAGRGGGRGRIWVLENGRPRPYDVRTGITDGASTEIGAAGLAEGMEVIVGIVSGTGSGGSTPRPAGVPPRMF